MAFIQGANTVVSDKAFIPRSGTSASRPASPTSGTLYYNTTYNMLEIYTGSSWTSLTYPTPTASDNGAELVNSGDSVYWNWPGALQATTFSATYETRSIFTHGFLAGGYKASQPWRSLNRTWHPTDITIYQGEQLDYAASFVAGTFSDYNAYVYGTIDSYPGSSNHTSSYNLHTGIMRQWNTVYNSYGAGTVPYGYTGSDPANDGAGVNYGTTDSGSGYGGMAMSVSRDKHGAATAMSYFCGYVTGGGSAVTEKTHFPTEINYTTTSNGTLTGTTTGVGGENTSYFNTAGTGKQLAHSTDTYSSWTLTTAGGTTYTMDTNGDNAGMPTKKGFHYFGYGTGATNTMAKFNDSNGVVISTLSKSYSSRQENYQMGQDWGYMMGMYDGTYENNNTTKLTYSNDTFTIMGASTRPKGHYGHASGCCASAAAQITAGRRT